MLHVLVLALALQQEPAVLDQPVYRDTTWHVTLPRPFDDWVFAPATSRGTTTVIFQPKNAALSDQLWGALVLTPWGRPVPLGTVADRRVRTWRPTLGSGFTLRSRDSLDVAGWPAFHLAMSGAVNRAVLDIEEYLIARDSDLIVLQLRYPRGVPRDSIDAGYRRVVEGMRIGARHLEAEARAPTPTPARPRVSPWLVEVERGQLRLDLPDAFDAVAPGTLSTNASSGGRRLMRWRPLIGEADTSLYAIGHYRRETRRVGRLTVHIWREISGDTIPVRVTDSLVALAARAWRTYWRDFGPLPVTEIALVETAWDSTRGAGAAVFLGADATAAVVGRELSRAWWGGAVISDSTSDLLVRVALPEWSATLVTGDSTAAGAPPTALARARQIAGDARFREAVRTFVAESRNASPATSALVVVLGPEASAALRQLIHQ